MFNITNLAQPTWQKLPHFLRVRGYFEPSRNGFTQIRSIVDSVTDLRGVAVAGKDVNESLQLIED